MIWRVKPWLAELDQNARSLDAAVAELRGDKDSADFDLFFRIERALLLSAFTIRKLHENGKLSSRAEEPWVSATLYRIHADKKSLRHAILQFGSVLPHLVCEMSTANHKKILLRQACNYIIHTNMIAYSHESDDDGFYFWILEGESTRNFVSIRIDTWVSTIREVPYFLDNAG